MAIWRSGYDLISLIILILPLFLVYASLWVSFPLFFLIFFFYWSVGQGPVWLAKHFVYRRFCFSVFFLSLFGFLSLETFLISTTGVFILFGGGWGEVVGWLAGVGGGVRHHIFYIFCPPMSSLQSVQAYPFLSLLLLCENKALSSLLLLFTTGGRSPPPFFLPIDGGTRRALGYIYSFVPFRSVPPGCISFTFILFFSTPSLRSHGGWVSYPVKVYIFFSPSFLSVWVIFHPLRPSEWWERRRRKKRGGGGGSESRWDFSSSSSYSPP